MSRGERLCPSTRAALRRFPENRLGKHKLVPADVAVSFEDRLIVALAGAHLQHKPVLIVLSRARMLDDQHCDAHLWVRGNDAEELSHSNS